MLVVVPLSLAAVAHADAVIGEMERQLRAPNPGRMDGRFAMLAQQCLQQGMPACEAAFGPGQVEHHVLHTVPVAGLG